MFKFCLIWCGISKILTIKPNYKIALCFYPLDLFDTGTGIKPRFSIS